MHALSLFATVALLIPLGEFNKMFPLDPHLRSMLGDIEQNLAVSIDVWKISKSSAQHTRGALSALTPPQRSTNSYWLNVTNKAVQTALQQAINERRDDAVMRMLAFASRALDTAATMDNALAEAKPRSEKSRRASVQVTLIDHKLVVRCTFVPKPKKHEN
jgi:hypothetical protein